VTIIEIMFVLMIIFVLVALLLPSVLQSREQARRYQCRNNLMQIGLALRNYESTHDRLPPGTVDPNRPIKNVPRGYHVGWVVRILPHLEQAAAYRQFDFSVGVYDKKNNAAVGGSLVVMRCPTSGGYAGCHHDVEAPIDIDNSGVLFLNRCIALDDVTDGLSHTIFVGELIDGGFGWAAGTRDTLRNTGTPISATGSLLRAGTVVTAVDPEKVNALAVGGFGSPHIGGANFLFGDGAVRFLSAYISMPVYQQLGHRADGKLLSDDF
jgi:prepilin-type processing-associated H-X9-DG protein